LNYSNFQNRQIVNIELDSDTSRFAQVSQSADAMFRYTLPKGNNIHSFRLRLGTNTIEDVSGLPSSGFYRTRLYRGTLYYQLKLRQQKLSIRPGFTYQQYENFYDASTQYRITLLLSKYLLKNKLTLNLIPAWIYTQRTQAQGQSLNLRVSAMYRAGRKHRFGLNSVFLSNRYEGGTAPDFWEWRGSISYTYLLGRRG